MMKINRFYLLRNNCVLLERFLKLSGSKTCLAKNAEDSKFMLVPKIKSNVKYDNSVKSIKYITPLRSLKEYILTAKDLEKLPKYFSRSPYANEVQTQVYLRAFEKHGGEEAFKIKRKIMRDMERKANAVSVSFLCSNFCKSQYESNFSVFKSGSGRVIAFAILVNGMNMAAKGMAWWYTGSKSMFSEMMHSAADTLNQAILAVGIYKAAQKPDEEHPYGYVSMRNISSLISGVGVFFLGSGVTFYHGVRGIIEPHEIESYQVALSVMAMSMITEGSTLLMAYNQTRKDAKKEYMFSGTADPSVSVILLEDAAAVLGILVATSAMGASVYYGSHIPDALGALGISGILAGVAAYIIRSNAAFLIGKAIPMEEQEAIAKVVDSAKIVRGTYDIKATLIGSDQVRFKAEVDIDGRELTRRYLETISPEQWLAEMGTVQTEEQALHFMLKHGDNLVNTLGAEINLIEQRIKQEFPKVKHIDIEIN